MNARRQPNNGGGRSLTLEICLDKIKNHLIEDVIPEVNMISQAPDASMFTEVDEFGNLRFPCLDHINSIFIFLNELFDVRRIKERDIRSHAKKVTESISKASGSYSALNLCLKHHIHFQGIKRHSAALYKDLRGVNSTLTKIKKIPEIKKVPAIKEVLKHPKTKKLIENLGK